MTGDVSLPGAGPGKFSDVPYAGLFGDTVIARVVEEIIADPHSVYRPRDLEDLTESSPPRIREALGTLTRLGLLKAHGGKHPSYTVNISTKTFVALTLLAYAVLDDREDSDCMNTAIRHYGESASPPINDSTTDAQRAQRIETHLSEIQKRLERIDEKIDERVYPPQSAMAPEFIRKIKKTGATIRKGKGKTYESMDAFIRAVSE